MKKLTRDLVVPIISARVPWLTFAITGSGLPSLPKFADLEQPRQALLARIEQLIDQVRFNPDIPSEEMRYEQLGKFRFVMEHTHHSGLIEPHYFGHCDRGHRRKATRLAGQVAPHQEIPLLWRATHGFLALLGNHGDLALAVHDVKDSICRISLAGGRLFSLFRYFALVLPRLRAIGKDFRTKGCFLLVFTDEVPRLIRAASGLIELISDFLLPNLICRVYRFAPGETCARTSVDLGQGKRVFSLAWSCRRRSAPSRMHSPNGYGSGATARYQDRDNELRSGAFPYKTKISLRWPRRLGVDLRWPRVRPRLSNPLGLVAPRTS